MLINLLNIAILLICRGFKRVLQLPTEIWKQMSMNLFCHSHENLPVAMATFRPQKMDCLVGDNILVVHQTVVRTNSVHFVQVIKARAPALEFD